MILKYLRSHLCEFQLSQSIAFSNRCNSEMGQAASSEAQQLGNGSQSSQPSTTKELEMYTKAELNDFFFRQAVLSLGAKTGNHILRNLELSTLDLHQLVTRSSLLRLLELPIPQTDDKMYCSAIDILLNSIIILGTYPFLHDYQDVQRAQLTNKSLVVSMLFFLGRYKDILPDFDYVKLIYIILAAGKNLPPHNSEKKSEDVDHPTDLNETPFVVELLSGTHGIRWATFSSILSFDEIDVSTLALDLKVLVQIFTLILIINSADRSNYTESITLKITDWDLYESVSWELVKYLNVNITPERLISISLIQFRTLLNGFPGIIETGLRMLSSRVLIDKEEREKQQKLDREVQLKQNQTTPSGVVRLKKTFAKFEPSKLVTWGTVALFSCLASETGFSVSEKNLVKLYSGAQAGFSIRSLELKIFKWQAPTIFIVSGKRLKKKTMETNKRYQQFSEEYPRYFRTFEDSKKLWQRDNDKITYAVFIHQPWRASNKKNFGDTKTTILSISPRLDIFKSIPNSIHKGELIYFNNLGLGLGFGNEQPINKNGSKHYFPGDTLLTIEANLEFAIFRHISTPTSNTNRYFSTTEQAQLRKEDYEDRFLISDLEVWGIGSNKELDEQRRQWEWENKQAEALQSVNVRNMGEERAFLEMAGIIGNSGGGGSI